MSEPCFKCLGDGGWHDCGEDTCPCADTEQNDEFWEVCDECNGAGELGRDIMKDRYNLSCSECKHEFSAAPSIMMLSGMNSGHGRCPKCKEFLHLEVYPDLSGEIMKSEKHSDWLTKRVTKGFQ